MFRNENNQSKAVNCTEQDFFRYQESYRNLALQGLEIEILNQFDFFLEENGEMDSEEKFGVSQ